MTKGYIIPAWLSMWLPNIVLGIAGVALLMSPRPFGRSADSHPAAAAARCPAGCQRPAAPRAGRSAASQAPPPRSAARRPRRPRDPDPAVRAAPPEPARHLRRAAVPAHPGDDDRRHARAVLHLDVPRPVGQVVQGPDHVRTDRCAFLWWSTPQFMAYIIALAVLLSALVTIGVLTKNSELIVMRACGVSLYRTAAPMVAFALVASADPVRHGGTRAGGRQSPRRSAEAPDSRRVGADLRRPEPQVDRRPRRRGVPLSVLQPADAAS